MKAWIDSKLELRFTGPAPADIKAELKAAGWKWDQRRVAYTHDYSPMAEKRAKDIVARVNNDSSRG